MFKSMFNTMNEDLEVIVPVVDRVHGESHPEFHHVKRIYDTIAENIENESFDFKTKFKELNEITNNYEVPDDVCNTYRSVYEMLKKLENSLK